MEGEYGSGKEGVTMMRRTKRGQKERKFVTNTEKNKVGDDNEDISCLKKEGKRVMVRKEKKL